MSKAMQTGARVLARCWRAGGGRKEEGLKIGDEEQIWGSGSPSELPEDAWDPNVATHRHTR
eukprot:6656045-Alexandrium_andersonii.AAC.1